MANIKSAQKPQVNSRTKKQVRFKKGVNVIPPKTIKQGAQKQVKTKTNRKGMMMPQQGMMMPQQGMMMPQQGKQNNEEDSSMNDDNIRPLGSPGMYGMIVLSLFAFAGYLQFSSFKETFKETFK